MEQNTNVIPSVIAQGTSYWILPNKYRSAAKILLKFSNFFLGEIQCNDVENLELNEIKLLISRKPQQFSTFVDNASSSDNYDPEESSDSANCSSSCSTCSTSSTSSDSTIGNRQINQPGKSQKYIEVIFSSLILFIF